jgi:hypothetical protein
VLAAAFLALCASVALLVAVAALGTGDWTVAGYAALVGVFFLLILAHGVLVWLLPQHTDHDITLDQHHGDPALALRYSAPLFAILVAIMGCLTLTFGTATVDLLRRAGTAGLPAGLLFAAATILCGSFLVVTIRGRLARGVVMLTPRGVYQRGRAFESFLPWASILGTKARYDATTAQVLIVARPDGQWDRCQTEPFWRLDRLPPVPAIIIDCLALGIDQNLVHHVITYYVDHPEARMELGTQAALTRVDDLRQALT